METVEAVKCKECGKLHALDSYEFVRVEHLYIGEGGGILNEGEHIFCIQCFLSFISSQLTVPPVYRNAS